MEWVYCTIHLCIYSRYLNYLDSVGFTHAEVITVCKIETFLCCAYVAVGMKKTLCSFISLLQLTRMRKQYKQLSLFLPSSLSFKLFFLSSCTFKWRESIIFKYTVLNVKKEKKCSFLEEGKKPKTNRKKEVKRESTQLLIFKQYKSWEKWLDKNVQWLLNLLVLFVRERLNSMSRNSRKGNSMLAWCLTLMIKKQNIGRKKKIILEINNWIEIIQHDWFKF